MVIICHRNSKCTFGANKTPMLASLAFGAKKHVKLSSVILFRLVNATSSSWSRSWSDRAEILLSFFSSPFCTPATLARTQSEEHVLDRKIEYVVCAIKIGLSILMTPSLCEIRQFFGQIVQSGKTLSKTLHALDCCPGYILYIVMALSGTVAVFYCEYGSID